MISLATGRKTPTLKCETRTFKAASQFNQGSTWHIMAVDLTLLDQDFRANVVKLLANCAARGVTMVPYFGVRTPLEQAKLWRQSRSREEIEGKIQYLELEGAYYIAECLRKAGPQSGPPVTNALPGESFHGWGLAVDCFWKVNGQANWTRPEDEPIGLKAKNGYQIYAEEAVLLKMTPGGFWKMKDHPHVQKYAYKIHDQYSWPEIDAEMRNRYDRV